MIEPVFRLPPSDFRLSFFYQPTSPVIVKIVEPKAESLYDVLFGALGLTGVLTLASIVAAVIFAAILFWVRSRA